MTTDPTPFLEAAARIGAHITCFELRKSGVMPYKVRVQLWCVDPDDPSRYKSTEFESKIVPELYEASFQEYLRRVVELEIEQRLKSEQADPLNIEDVINDVQQFIHNEKTEPPSTGEGGSE